MDLAPPITFVDEGGGTGPLFASAEDLADYLEWPDQFDGPAEAYDADRRHLVLALDAAGRLEVSIGPTFDREALEARLREIVGDRTIRFGLLDADVDLDVLLRALWRWESGKRPYPGG